MEAESIRLSTPHVEEAKSTPHISSLTARLVFLLNPGATKPRELAKGQWIPWCPAQKSGFITLDGWHRPTLASASVQRVLVGVTSPSETASRQCFALLPGKQGEAGSGPWIEIPGVSFDVSVCPWYLKASRIKGLRGWWWKRAGGISVAAPGEPKNALQINEAGRNGRAVRQEAGVSCWGSN